MDPSFMLRSSRWVFDAEVAEAFDEHVRLSVPGYEELHWMIAQLSSGFVSDGSVVCDVGTSTGYAIRNLHAVHRDKHLTFVGYDESESMLAVARHLCGGMGEVAFVRGTIEAAELPRCDLVLCVYTLMFTPTQVRQAVLARMHDALTPNGALVIAEKTFSRCAELQRAYTRCHEDMKRRNGLTGGHIAAKRRALEGVLRPLTVDDYLRMLGEAGFRTANVFFRWCNFVGILAVK